MRPDVMVRLFGDLEWHHLKRIYWASRISLGTSKERRNARNRHSYHVKKVKGIVAQLSKG